MAFLQLNVNHPLFPGSNSTTNIPSPHGDVVYTWGREGRRRVISLTDPVPQAFRRAGRHRPGIMNESLLERPGLPSIEKHNHSKTIVEAVPGGLVIPKPNYGFSRRVESVNGSFLMPVVIISKWPKGTGP
jgi:hypothetical protein